MHFRKYGNLSNENVNTNNSKGRGFMVKLQ